jgi:hypothetical protein
MIGRGVWGEGGGKCFVAMENKGEKSRATKAQERGQASIGQRRGDSGGRVRKSACQGIFADRAVPFTVLYGNVEHVRGRERNGIVLKRVEARG